jgi:hypothetical protein
VIGFESAAAEGRDFHDTLPAQLFPFMEQMGTWPNANPKEFWWEREWRHAGNLELLATGVIWLCPESEIDQINVRVGRNLTPWIDPLWGLEEIVAHLAGFPPNEVSPFTQAAPAEPEFPDDLPF